MAAEGEAAAADDANAGEGGEKKKKLPGKVIVLFIVAPVLLLCVLAAVFFLFLGGDKEEHAEEGHDTHAHSDDRHGEAKDDHHGKDEKHAAHDTDEGAIPVLNPEDAIFFDLPDILVNLNTVGTRQVYLKLRVALELHKEADTDALDTALPRVIDKFQVYLREMRVEDLSGSSGLFRLKEELLRRVNAATHPIHVYDVLFKEMLIQ